MLSWGFIVISTVMSISSQLTLKYALGRLSLTTSQRPLLLRIATSPLIVLGLGIYCFGVIFWLMALSRLDVSLVYPFASLSYVGIIVASHFLFHEHVPARRFLGVGVIIVGVVLIGLSSAL